MPGLDGVSSLPEGNYTIIGVDIDTTGRRLIDEIVHLAAYTPNSQFSQYVMPYMNLNPAARQRHQVRVITIGFFRMLKSMQTYKVMKTKPEYAALVDFLEWLEAQKANQQDSKGLILLYHEQRKFVPYMLLEALKKYGMLPRFENSVAGFANMYSLAEKECGATLKYFTLRELSKVILNTEEENKNDFEGSAKVRSRITYEVARVLANKIQANPPPPIVKKEEEAASQDAPQDDQPKEPQEPKAEPSDEDMNVVFHRVIVGMSSSLEENMRELSGQQSILDRQNSLRSIFINYFKTTLYHRVKGVTYRRVLAEQGFDMAKLQDIWMEGKRESLKAAVDGLEELKEEDKMELIELLDCHFDPDKQPIKPEVRKNNNKRRRFQGGNGGGRGGGRQQHRISPRKKNIPKQNHNQQRNSHNHHQQNHDQNHQQHNNNRGHHHNRGTPQKKQMQHVQKDFQQQNPRMEPLEMPPAPPVAQVAS